ncbi:feruloyl esterase [Noviherbaspirillum humi]|uniref:Feruloyl esterase n=1 Tax=Noviherbaspirillum humi TaxID=1688639 RepID=A0A239J1P3_9BURK|nr:tannase/feruloyl esterase family alpha/beta hydrolase [Noviherbaspirillum humi]SNS99841.1 feruloyl esterase [Noviherbaspirillum humi]
MKRHSKALLGTGVAAVTGLILAACGGNDDPAPSASTTNQNTNAATQAATSCANLAGTKIDKAEIGLPTNGAEVQSATLVAASAAGNTNGEFCQVKGIIKPVTTTSNGVPTENMEFEVNLPTNWNNKAMQLGGGGLNGSLVTGLGAVPLAPANYATPLSRGYVTLGSDGGHKGAGGFDGRFMVNDEMLLNYGHQSVKKTHDVAMALIKKRYSAAPQRFYFVGASQGGHEALDAAARYPTDYDGVVANYPAYNVTMLHLGSLNVGKAVYGNGGAGWLNPVKTKLIVDKVYEACDTVALDGARDGIISNVAGCNAAFNIDTVKRNVDAGGLRCPSGGDEGDTCLSDAQIAAVEQITSPYTPGVSVAGMDTFPRWALLEGSTFVGGSTFGAANAPSANGTGDALLYSAGAATTRYAITRNPNLDPLTFDPTAWESDIKRVASIMDVTNQSLNSFREKGGKVIMTHGTADDFITPYNSIAYYQRQQQQYTQSQLDSFLRFYVIPGLSHGFGNFNAGYDSIGLLENWVERGQAPGDTVASDKNTGTSGTPANKGSRPMCVFPKWPKFTGAVDADTSKAANYVCQAPA